jgi:hypothetical protein
MGRAWRGLAGIQAAEAVLLAESWLRLFWLGLLRLRAPERLSSLVSPRLEGAGGGPATASRPATDRIAQLVCWSARLQPIPATCLCRALVLRDALSRRGIPGLLRIGVRRAERPLDAHAWVEAGGRTVGEVEPRTQGFQVLGRAAQS